MESKFREERSSLIIQSIPLTLDVRKKSVMGTHSSDQVYLTFMNSKKVDVILQVSPYYNLQG